MLVHRAVLGVTVAVCAAMAAEDPADPWIDRIEPLGGQQGTATEVALVGRNLSTPATLEFDSPHLSWETVSFEKDDVLRGIVRVDRSAPPGPHIVTLTTPLGRTNSRMFYVDSLPSSAEAEPNDSMASAQPVELQAQTLHGAMPTLPDRDFFVFEASEGERWTFDLRSLEYGGFLENDLTLLDGSGKVVAFSDDRDDYLETPFLEHEFGQDGTYYLKLDQYRGPQRVNCHRNCGYMLRIADLPVVEAAHPLGARVGSTLELSLRGRGLRQIESAWLSPVRRAEYYRLTFPFTIPLRTDERPGQRIDGKVGDRSDHEARLRFVIPRDAWQGLWRVWVGSPGGASDAISLEISSMAEPDCVVISPSPEGVACNAVLERPGEEHEYWLELAPGQPVVVTTLAAQLGVPRLDTVLELFDEKGRMVAEHDDLMTGQGTVIGNPDSMLHFRAEAGGRFRALVRDRVGRGGPDMVYRLRVEEREPGYALLADPENLNVHVGTTERVGILMTPEPGFGRAVKVWIEDPPEGISAKSVEFRAGQFFGPSGDGDNVVIPEVFLEVAVDSDLPPGDYPLRLLGRTDADSLTVEAFSTLWIGPPRKRNDVRRPLKSIRLTVLGVEAAAEDRSVSVRAGAGSR